MTKLAVSALDSLRALDVNSNVDIFAHQWVKQHGIADLDDYFTLLDRLNIPYHLETLPDQVIKSEHRVIVVASPQTIAIYRHNGHYFEKYESGSGFVQSDEPFYIDAKSVAIVLENVPAERPDPDWVGSRLFAFKAVIPKLLLASFFANLFALSIPFITMSIYDHVIGGDAGHELNGIAIGAILLFTMLWILRVVRNQTLTSVSSRISREISNALVKKLLTNSYHVTKNTPRSLQINQLSFGDRISGVLTGPLGNTLFDLPFVLLFLIAIGFLGGWLVIVPIISLTLYYLIASRSIKKSVIRANQSTIAGTNRQTMIAELSSNLGYLRTSKAYSGWQERFNKANQLATKNGFLQASHQAKFTSVYYLIGVLSTLSVIGLGIELIFQNVMSPGGLIATMMLISRVTGPAQTLSNSALRLQQLNQTQSQINRTLTINSEETFRFQHHDLAEHAPTIELDQITLRYPNQSKPALSAINAVIEAGDIIAITGPSNSGKTSLIQTLACLQPVQNGTVNINGINLSQYAPVLFRNWLFYQAAHPEVLLFDIRSWFSDNSSISDAEIVKAIDKVGGRAWFDSLENGLDCKLSELWPQNSYDLLSNYEAKILISAKAVACQYPLYLFDGPVHDSSPESIQCFSDFLLSRKGASTIIYTSQDPNIIKLANKVMVLDQGSVAYFGPFGDEPQAASKEFQQQEVPSNE